MSEADSKLSLPKVVRDEASGNLSSLDSNDSDPSSYGMMDAVPAVIGVAFMVFV